MSPSPPPDPCHSTSVFQHIPHPCPDVFSPTNKHIHRVHMILDVYLMTGKHSVLIFSSPCPTRAPPMLRSVGHFFHRARNRGRKGEKEGGSMLDSLPSPSLCMRPLLGLMSGEAKGPIKHCGMCFVCSHFNSVLMQTCVSETHDFN